MRLRVAHWMVALSVVPALGGVTRLAGLAGVDGAPIDARFAQNPWPAVLHIVTATLFSVLGAFQFKTGFRSSWPRWHRYAGRVLVLSGLLTAATVVWMTLQYGIPAHLQGSLLFWVRLVVGSAMGLSLVLAVMAILAGNVRSHKAWTIRGYALAQGAGTQALLLLPAQLLTGAAVTGPLRDVLMTAAWAANVLVAEFVIQRGDRLPSDPTRTPLGRRIALPFGVSSQ